MDAQEFRDRSGGEHEAVAAGERLIADRLDALEAERVLARAIELDQASGEERIALSAEQLEKVAEEIGVDPAFVRQALGEVRLGADERSRLDRLILPDALVETATLDGWTREEADLFVNRYMREFEGLVEGQRHPDGIDWDVDTRLTSRMRTTVATGSNRVSRVAGNDIAHRIRTVGSDQHVVAMQSDGDRPLTFAKLGLGLALFVLLGGTVGAIGIGIGSFIQAVAGLSITSGAIAAGSIWLARRWSGKVRRALRRSMTRLTDLAARNKPAEAPPEPRRKRRWR